MKFRAKTDCILGLRHWLITTIAVLLAGCSGSDPQPQATQPSSKPKAAASQASSATTRVKAVATGPGAAPVELQFELAARPQLNEPVEVNLYLQGINDATMLELTVKPEGKLAVTTGAQASFASIKVGELLTHSFSLRSASTGIQVADVQLLATLDGQPKTFNFAIPIAISPNTSAASSANP